MTERTPVLFRKFEGEVTAVFPTIPGDNDPLTMTCYAHIGQHGSAHEAWVRQAKPAVPTEYADLLEELQSIGYSNLVIRKRLSRRDRQARMRELAQ